MVIIEYKVFFRRIKREDGSRGRLYYYLLVDTIPSSHFFCEVYGVRISDDRGLERTIPALTTSAAEIDELISVLANQLVTPTTLDDIVSDWKNTQKKAPELAPAP